MAGKLFGTRALWRGQIKIGVSDPHRTIIDMLDNPAGGGGIRPYLTTYLARSEAGPES